MKRRTRLAAAVTLLAILCLVFIVLLFRGTFENLPHAASESGDWARATSAPLAEESTPSALRETVERPDEAKVPFPSPVEVEAFGTLKVHVRWGSDHAPASGIGARVICGGDPDPYSAARDEVSGIDGLFVCEQVAAGYGIIVLDRDPMNRTTFQVEPGAVCEVTAEVPPGALVEGIVFDPDRRPFPGADVMLLPGLNEHGFVVARSGADGTFAIRDVNYVNLIGARAAGYAPSVLPEIFGESGETIQVELVLGRVGGGVQGVVFGHDGTPVAGARVRLSDPSAGILESVAHPGGLRARKTMAQRVMCDENGAFVFASVEPGNLLLEVRAPHRAPWRQELLVPAGTNVPVMVRLVEGARLTGRVLDSGNLPIEAQVIVGQSEDFNHSLRQTTEDGSFAFDDVPIGLYEVHAYTNENGQAHARLFGVSGQEIQHDLVLSTGLVIAARLVDERSEPLAGFWVDAQARGGMGTAMSDGDGRIRILNCLDLPYTLEVHAPESRLPFHVFRNVKPQPDEILLRVPYSPDAFARIVLTVLGPDGRPIGGAKVQLTGRYGGMTSHKTEELTGHCVIEDVPPAEYQLSVSSPGLTPWTSAFLLLSAGETLDLGEVTINLAGRLFATLNPAPGLTPDSSLRAELVGVAAGPNHKLTREGGGFRSEPIAPGRYSLRVQGYGIAAVALDVTVEPNRDTQVDVPLQLGEECRLEIRKATEKDPTRVRVVVTGPDERPVLESHLWREKEASHWTATICLAPGDYHVVAETPDGRRASSNIVVESESSNRVDLRLP